MTIEGPSADEAKDQLKVGNELIDVGLYFGDERREHAHLVRYIQLKHSTRHSRTPWTASGLKQTISGFAKRYAEIIERVSSDDVDRRFRFDFTTNRPIDPKLTEALEDLASGAATRHPEIQSMLAGFTGLAAPHVSRFFSLFSAEGSEGDLWEQRNLLARDLSIYLPDTDFDAPVQLKELVTRKATSEFESDPSIRRHDVLRALKATEEQLRPAECLIPEASNTLPREQETEILRVLLTSRVPLVIHAEGGVGKSVISARLAASMPAGSEAVLYDCFGDGLYRSPIGFRHRHRDALVQIANELSARAHCHPLIPTPYADTKQYMRAFVGRLHQAVGLLRAREPTARLCVLIDAADNAQIVAEEQREPGSFVQDLIRTPMPEGVQLAFTCRTHRRHLLKSPPEVVEIELRPFSLSESTKHLRRVHPEASDAEASEFAEGSSFNPRVQALALSRGLSLHEMLKELGPEPTTVDRAIGDLLSSVIAQLRDLAGGAEASQIDTVCRGLAVLRPPVPIPVLAQLSGISESAIRTFALDFGRPLLRRGNSLRFLDEPTETWFRERFAPDDVQFEAFLRRLRPLASHSSYAAATLPQFLLQAGKLDELVKLALSEENLPTENPLERRDVELQRLIFALKACLQQRKHLAAAKLALKAGGECAGERRQNRAIQENTDIAAILMAPDRISEIVSRRTFDSTWMGSYHAYDAGLLSGREEFSAEASSHLRMAEDWLAAWTRRSAEERRHESVTDEDIAEIAMALLRLQGPKAAARFLRGWTPRIHTLAAGRLVGRRLVDHGQHEQLDELSVSAGSDLWLILGLALEATSVGHTLPARPLARTLRLLTDRRVKLPEVRDWNNEWTVLDGVRSVVELALRAVPPQPDQWAAILRRYLPDEPPSALVSPFEHSRPLLLRAYALEAALRGQRLELIDIAPPDIRNQMDAPSRHHYSQNLEIFQTECHALLPWFILCADMRCGRSPANFAAALEAAAKATSAAESRNRQRSNAIRQVAALEWFRILRELGAANAPEIDTFKTWIGQGASSLLPGTLISLCRAAARAKGFERLAIELAGEAYEALEGSRENAESRTGSYLKLARAILVVSLEDARIYFNGAVKIASRIGDENLSRWAALLQIAKAAADRNVPRPQTAYRLSRAAELTYEYVERDKHFNWDETVEVLTGLCASSAIAILSRWRDRRFGDPGRLLPVVIRHLIEQGQVPNMAPIAFAGLAARWDRVKDLERAVASEDDSAARSRIAQIAYRYIRVQSADEHTWFDLKKLRDAYHLDFPDLDRLIAATDRISAENEAQPTLASTPREEGHRAPRWEMILQDTDLTDSAEVRSAYTLVRTDGPPYDTREFFRQALSRVKVGREPDLVRAIAAWPDFGVHDLSDLLKALPSPMPKQVSLRTAVRDAVLLACRRDPRHVYRRHWASWLPLEALHAEGIVLDEDVVRAMLEGFAAQIDSLEASDLFQVLNPLAACLSADEADESLTFGLDLLEKVLRDDDGDGPWSDKLQPPRNVFCAMAGYVWAGLGSPDIAERWQFAHAVRSLVELGWTELFEALIDAATKATAAPFVDDRLEFYLWHARQWLLVGLARGAQENARTLRPATTLLLDCIRVEHVIIRELASQTLRSLIAAGEVNSNEAVDLISINQPKLPAVVYSGWSSYDQEEAASDESHDEAYYFGIDIGPYWFSRLGNAFGLTQQAIEQRARQAIRQDMGWERGLDWRKDARHVRKIFDRSETFHSKSQLPRTDDLRSYFAYHAMMIVASTLLVECPVRHRADEPLDEFREWLFEYLPFRANGQWLADRRDPRLVVDPPAPRGYGDKEWRWNVTADYLDQLLKTDDGMIVVWGNWSSNKSEHSESISIRSALASRAGADALVAALQTSPHLGRFVLPLAREEALQVGSLTLNGWILHEAVSDLPDEKDPWATGLHYPGNMPSPDTIANLDLTQRADGRLWTNSSGAMLRSEIWTYNRGHGQEAEAISCERTSANMGFLKHLLDINPEDCLILSVEVRRRSPHHANGGDALDSYPQPYVRYYLMGADCVAHTL